MYLKKSVIYLLLFLFMTGIFVGESNALSNFEYSSDYMKVLDGNFKDDEEAKNCDALFGDPNTPGDFANYLQQIFNLFKYLAPTLVIVLSIMEFIKAEASQKDDALIRATKKTGTRLILALILFFIPSLVNFLFHLLGWYGTCGIG